MKATIEINMPNNCSDCDLSYRDWHLFCPIMEKQVDEIGADGQCPDKGRRKDCPLKTAPRFFSREDMKTYYPEE